MTKLYNFVYITTNNINGDYYIGKHSTDNLNDGYIGSGVVLNRAIKKYGRSNFTMSVLQYFDTEEEAYQYEYEIVTEDEVNNPHCYNITIGGKGGIKLYNLSDSAKLQHKIYYSKPENRLHASIKSKEAWSKPEIRKKYLNSMHKASLKPEVKQNRSNAQKIAQNRQETKIKKSNARKGKAPWNKGKKTGQDTFKNTIWINNGFYNKRISPDKFDYYKQQGFEHGMITK